MQRLICLISALAGFLPLLCLVIWAYEPGRPFAYPDVRELLTTPYQRPATPLYADAFRLRFGAATGFSVLCLAGLSFLSTSWRSFFLAGVLSAMLLSSPLLVDWILGAQNPASALMSVLGGAALCFMLVLVIRRSAALPLPLAAISLVAGVLLTVRTAGDVAIRSEPILAVLNNAAHQPEDPEVQLALGLHLLSMDGPCAAQPYLRSAGSKLARRFSVSGEDDLLQSAEILADLTLTPDNSTNPCEVTASPDAP